MDPGRRDFHLRGDSRFFIRTTDVGTDEVHDRHDPVGPVKPGATFRTE